MSEQQRDAIERLIREIEEDTRRWREQMARHRAYEQQIQMMTDHAVLCFQLATAQMWAAALRPASKLEKP